MRLPLIWMAPYTPIIVFISASCLLSSGNINCSEPWNARDTLRSAAHEGRFYDLQARIMADILKDDPGKIYTKNNSSFTAAGAPL
jgi:hypothetical protein